MIKRKCTAALGIDINEKVISAVELRSKRGKLSIRRAGTVPTPDGAVARGVVTDPRSVARAMEALFKTKGLSRKGKPVFVSLAGACSVVRLTALPRSGPAAVREHIQEEIRRYAVFSGERTVSDFIVTGTAGERGGTKSACLAAAKEESAAALVQALMYAGIHPVAVDIAPLAAVRALHHGIHAPGPCPVEIFTVVEPGSVHLMVIRHGSLCFSHAAHEAIDLLDGNPGGADRLGATVNIVLDHYDAEIGKLSEVEKIVVVTAQALPPDVCAQIRRALEGQNVVFSSSASALRDTGLEGNEIPDPPTVCAAGLALRAFDETRFPLNLNLLPAAAVRIQEFKKRLLVVSILAAVLFLIALLGAGAIHLGQRSLESGFLELEEKISSVVLSPELMKSRNEVVQLEKQLQGERKFHELAGCRVSWAGLLERIAKIIPRDVRLTRLEEDGSGDMIIQGESYSADSVYRFARPFNDCELVESAKLSSLNEIKMNGEALVGFSMDCELHTGSPDRE